MDSPNDRVSSD